MTDKLFDTETCICLICGARVQPKIYRKKYGYDFDYWFCPLCDNEILC